MCMLKDISIKRKLIIIIMVTSIVALLLTSVAFVAYDLITLRQAMIQDVSMLSQVISANSTAALIFNDRRAAEENLEAFIYSPQIVAACIYNNEGRIFASYVRSDMAGQLSLPAPQDAGYHFGSNYLTMFRRVDLDNKPIGMVYVQYDLEELRSRAQRNTVIVIIIVMVVSCTTFIVSSRLQRVISEPILNLAKTAKLISQEKRYSLRAEKHGKDEVGLLIDGFNEMLSEIQKRDAELESQRGFLEVQVAERTADLRRTNKELLDEIQERAKTEDELLKARRLESIGLLAGGIAHDFNNLLTAILGNISLAKMHVPREGRAFERLLEAEKASMRASDLTNQLLTFSKGGAPVKKTASVVELLIDSASFALSGSNVKCEFDLAEDIWPADIDEGQISQVINNVIINADHAMTEGGLIMVQARNVVISEADRLPLKEGRYIKISIRDQGTGIPSDMLPKIFDPYFTTKPKGTGLGLTTCYSIVKRHDGLITAESVMGSGSTFFIYLPASEGKVNAGRGEIESSLSGKGKVLVMDDEEMIREVAGRMLNHLGYEVGLAADGNEAVALYTTAKSEGNPFDIVIMDLTIPGGMGGKETIQKLAEIDPGIRALVSSGYSHGPITAEYRKFGFCGVV
ncbi:MAG TPA: ATP-binding protein, partial [Dissulfurispiraceae bacterium]|nr:ATP-binding protein [Dissulfurispiraceae bacterium]